MILSQPNIVSSQKSNTIKTSTLTQSTQLQRPPPKIFLTHEHFSQIKGSWTIFPIISDLHHAISQQSNHISSINKWIIFCDDQSQVNLEKLLNALESETRQFLGHKLFDREATIIHHFARHMDPTSFHYPLLSAGFIMSHKLLQQLNDQKMKFSDFAIDASYEFADYLWTNFNQTKLTNVPYLCSHLQNSRECAIYHDISPSTCNKAVAIDRIYFAVKTCKQFHKERVPVIQSTWVKYVEHIKYFSDERDTTIPTFKVGVKNTDTGHCEKTFLILKQVLKEIREEDLNIHWIVLADDDTLLRYVGFITKQFD